MSCPEFNELMSYADGEVAGADAARIRAHLEQCGSCRALLASQSDIENLYRGGFTEPSEARMESLGASIASDMRRRRFYTRVLPIAAALLVAIGGMRFMIRERIVEIPGTGGDLPVATQPAAGAGGEMSAETVLVTASVPPTPQLAADDVLMEQQDLGAGEESRTGDLLSQTVETVSSGTAGGAMPADSGGTFYCYGGSGTVADVQSTIADQTVAADREDDRYMLEQPATPLGGAEIADGAGGGGGAASGATAFGRTGEVGQSQEVSSEVFESGYAQEAEGGDYDNLPGCAGLAVSTVAAQRACERCAVVLEFDSSGNACSPDSLLLDEALPGWKDSLQGRIVDSILVVPVKELEEFLNE